MTPTILLEIDSHGTALLTINRPDVRNALNWEAMHALRERVKHLQAESEVRLVIVTGAGGKAFISGGDLRDLHSAHSEDDALRQHDLMTGTLNLMATLPVPTIAAIEGAARGGGCEVALACDLRIAASDATLGFAQIDMAITPGWGGAGRLFDLVGYPRTLNLLLTGKTLDAQEAYNIGLIDEVCASGQALAAAQSFAAMLRTKPPLAVRGVKELLHGYRSMPRDAAFARERSLFARLWSSEDHVEGSAAFLEKRQAQFKGK
jgi:enoyl-CoA hydratase